MASFTRRQIAEVLARKTLRSGSFQDVVTSYHQVLQSGSLFEGSTSQSDIILYKDDFLSLQGLDTTDYNTLLNPASFHILSESLWDSTLGVWHDPTPLETLKGEGLIDDPSNISQYIAFDTESVSINPDKLNEVLDTDVFELLPTQLSRQDEINAFFNSYFKLRSGSTPPFCTDEDTGAVTLDNNEVIDGLTACGNNLNYIQWRDENDISYDEDMSGLFITRLNSEANADNAPSTEGGASDTSPL